MIRYSEERFNNPLPYIFIVFILSSLCFEIYSKNRLLAITIVSSFFIALYIFKGRYVLVVLLAAFIISTLNNIWFYEYKPNSFAEIRVIEAKRYYGKGKIEGRIVNLINIDEKIKIGDRIVAKGKFEENKNISKGIIGDYKINDYKLMKSDFICKLYKRRENIFKKIEEKLGNRKAALITSVAFGYKSELDEEHKELMRNLGISHAISVSGLHLALVYGVLLKIFGIKLSLIIAFVYMMFTGASPPAVRAYIMIFIINLGISVKRNYNPLAALSLAGIILLLVNPYDVYNVGFILSFLATLGIITFNEKLNKKLYKLPSIIRSTIAISVSAQIFTIPILIMYFNEMSLMFIIGNIIVIPFINFLVILGNILILIEPITGLFNYLLYLCHYIIKYIDVVMYKIENIGFGMIYLHHTVAYFYVSLLTTYYFYRRGYKRFLFYPAIMAIYIVILIYSPVITIRYYKEGGLLISHKGDRVLIQTKDVADKEKLKAISLTDEIIENPKKINIGNEVFLKEYGENYKLNIKNKEYILLVNFAKINYDCDIIDFRKGDIEEILLFNDRVINN